MTTVSTVNQFSDKQPAFTPSSLRALIFNADKNGLSKSGAIIRIGRKVLIDDDKFMTWIETQDKAGV